MRTILIFLLAVLLPGAVVSSNESQRHTTYYWRSLPVGGTGREASTARLLTLFCSACGTGTEAGRDIPLVTVLRDTLGNDDPADDKLTAVWLLSYLHSTIGEKVAAAVPFFYWPLGDGSSKVGGKDTSLLLDLSAPERPAVSNVGRQLLQWTTLDTIDTPIRATSRSYRTNQVDHERLHLEEAVTYLMRAPKTGGPDGLSQEECELVVARLELRKNLLGGFVEADKVAGLGKQSIYEQEEFRTRNWELLRQCAEKTGLLFEPLKIWESEDQYAMLWFPVRAASEPVSSDLGAVWKLLNLKDPYAGERMSKWNGISEIRSLDETGALLPPNTPGAKEVRLIPLGVYGLNYRRAPLLLVDFQNTQHLRRHEILQQTINELTGGVIGVSHFTNWYYFLGADLYNFYQARHGRATSRAERLDCYSQFRVALALDHQLDSGLREEMKRRVNSLSINPFEASPDREMKAALSRYTWLEVQAGGDNSRLLKRLDNQRREEIAAFGETPGRHAMDVALHGVTLGRYTHRAKADDGNLALLGDYRRVESQLAFLDRLVGAGTAPEVTQQESTIRTAVVTLTGLMREVKSAKVRTHVADTLDRLGKLSDDEGLRADCFRAVTAVRNGDQFHATTVPGIVASPAVSSGRLAPAAGPLREEFP